MSSTRTGGSRFSRASVEERERRRRDLRTSLPPESLTIGDSRQWVCSRAEGSVLEVCIGTGLNLPHYAGRVHLTGVDLDPQMLAVARLRANRQQVWGLVQADAASLPFTPASFDSVVCSLAMCEFRDRRAILREMYRVLRPGGRLLLLDHAQWRWPVRGRPVTLAVSVGFTPHRHERLRLGLIERLDARKPDEVDRPT